MKRFGLALAVGVLAVSAAPAQQPATAPQSGPTITTGTPVVGSGTIVQGDVITTAPARRGLFGRMRNRNTSSAPVITSYPTTTPGTVIPMPATTTAPNTSIPNPMPSTAPTPRTTGGGTSGIITTGDVVQASGTTVVTGEGVTTTGYAVPSTTTTTQSRRGIIARMRARR